jgi:pyridoxamine 5'-phosphate oxidase
MSTEVTEGDFDIDPKSWRSLLEISIAKSRKIRGSNYVQIATVNNGEPRCRTVVFRGFQNLPADHALSNHCDDMSCIMKMCTAKNSQKVAQNQQQPIAEMVWWFPKTSEQYRVRGSLILIGNDSDDKALATARKELWGNLGDPSRESFLETSVPGEAFSTSSSTKTPPAEGGRGEDGKVLPPPDNFLLMLLDPSDCDYLRLTGGQYRQIDARAKDSGWSYERVNP